MASCFAAVSLRRAPGDGLGDRPGQRHVARARGVAGFHRLSAAPTRVDTFAGVIAGEATLTPDGGEPVRLARLVVTRQFLPLLGVAPLTGRAFTADDERLGSAAVVLISERLWEACYQRDQRVLGRTIRLDERPYTVIGVVPEAADFGVLQVLAAADYSRGFADRDPRSTVDIWAPLQPDPKQLVRDTHPLLMIGRVAPGATVGSAQEELTSIAADLDARIPRTARAVSISIADRRDLWSDPGTTAGVAGGGWPRPVDCVRERGEPPAGAQLSPRA